MNSYHEAVQATEMGPVVLLIDSLKCHKSCQVKQRFMELVFFPFYITPGCTGVSQPIDVGLMRPFRKLHDACDDYLET